MNTTLLSRLCRTILLLLMAAPVLQACVDEEQYDDTPRGNLEALWRIIDERYCFFNEKQAEYGLDWQEVRQRYLPQADASLTESQQFELMAAMLSELRDGHVNLYSSFDQARYWKWHEDYPANVSDSLLRRYLGTDYKIAAGMRYRKLDDNVGYVRYASFQSGVGDGNLDEVLLALATCNGLIIDIRGNGGGLLTTAERIAARFTDEEITVGYMRHKTGKGHNDFSDMEEQRLKPSRRIRWHKPVVVLTNREVYSAANEFVKYMRCCPGVTVVGDATGGGGGLPFTDQLPSGWSVRFSACPMYDRDGRCVEEGIAPDHTVMLLPADEQRGVDTIIEYARQLLSSERQ